MQSTRFFDILTTILQPKGGCDVSISAGAAAATTHNHPSAERRLRLKIMSMILFLSVSQPSFSRKAVATCEECCHFASSFSQPSFSRKAVATCEKCRQRCRALLTTILQPKGGCDILRLARFGMVMAHNHPSAERRLRRRALGEGGVRALSQPSFSRKAVATRARSSCGRRTCLTTILQPKGGCDWPSVPRGSW